MPIYHDRFLATLSCTENNIGTKKITEYRLVGTQCIPIKEDITITDQIIKGIPSTNQVTTTASIAVVATAAAAATPFLLRIVKPIVKQIIKRVKKLLSRRYSVDKNCSKS